MSVPAARAAVTPAAEDISRALDRAAGARLIAGNELTHHPDSAVALGAMLDAIAQARRWVHFENYIIRDDHTGRRFADALASRARAGVRVRVLYDALGSLGTSGGYWRRLRAAGADVRAFNPLLPTRPFRVLRRDHRKVLVTDGALAMTGGVCIGDEWAGDPRRGRMPWRDTVVTVRGPGAAALDQTFARIWRRTGEPLPADELDASPAECGTSRVRVVEGVPGESRMYRAVQLFEAAVAERLWITDAYLIAPPPLFAGLLDAARGGVDVRLLLPGTSDLPVVRTFTRIGYRDLLAAGVRIFEWKGPMLHAKTMLADHEWARVGSSNLNLSSLVANYELDLLIECDRMTALLAEQFRRDLAAAREIIALPRRRFLPGRLVGAPAEAVVEAQAHKRSGREIRVAATVALGQVAGGARRAVAWIAALVLALIGALLLVFPRVMSITLAVLTFWLAFTLILYGFMRRRRRSDDGP